MEKLVKPLKTSRTTVGTVPRIDVSQNVGFTTAVADNMNGLLTKYKALKEQQMSILGENYYSALVGKSLDYETKMQYDKNYYEKDENLQKLNAERKLYTEEFLKVCEENGVNKDIANAYIQAGENRFKETKEKFLAKHTVWLEDKNREYFLMGLDEQANNISRKMISGNKEEGIKDFYNLSNKYFEAGERGDIKPSAVIDLILRDRKNVISADIEKWTNKGEEGLLQLKQMAGMSFEDFNKEYNSLNLKMYGKEVLLSEDDYQVFKRAVASGINTINSRISAEQEKNLFEQKKAEQWIRNNPVDAAMKNYVSGTVINEKFGEFALQVVNNKYGTDFKNLEEVITNNLPINLIGKSNDKSSIYNDVSIGGENMINEIILEANELCGGQDKSYKDNVLNARYNDGSTNIVPGARGTELLMKPESNYYRAYSAIYSEPNKQILTILKDVNINTDSLHKMYKDDYEAVSSIRHNINTMLPGQMSGNPYKNEEGIYGKTGKYTEMDIGGILRAMELAGESGDYNSARTAKDIRQLEADFAKLAIVNSTGGFLDKEVAEEIGEKDSAGLMIVDLKSGVKQKMFNYYLQEPRRLKKVFGVENEVMEKVGKELRGGIEEMLSETQAIDVGYGRFVSIPPGLKNGDIAKGIAAKLNKEEYITESGNLVSGKNVQLIGKPDDNMVIIMYNKRPVYKAIGKDKDGTPILKQAVLDLGEVK